MTPAYVQSQSDAAIALRLTTELPLKVESAIAALHNSQQHLVYAPPPDSETLVGRASRQLAQFKSWLRPPQYCIVKLDRIFNNIPRKDSLRG